MRYLSFDDHSAEQYRANDAIVFDTRRDAEETLAAMLDILYDYGDVRVADLYDLVGVRSRYSDTKYGWKNLDGATVLADYDGRYHIEFPKLDAFKCSYAPKSRVAEQAYDNDNQIKAEGADEYSDNDTMVSHPPHYQTESGLEAIDVIEAFTFDLNGIEATDTGNVIKYMCRWKKKNGIQDLEKAKWYLQHLIDHVNNISNKKENEDEYEND